MSSTQGHELWPSLVGLILHLARSALINNPLNQSLKCSKAFFLFFMFFSDIWPVKGVVNRERQTNKTHTPSVEAGCAEDLPTGLSGFTKVDLKSQGCPERTLLAKKNATHKWTGLMWLVLDLDFLYWLTFFLFKMYVNDLNLCCKNWFRLNLNWS